VASKNYFCDSAADAAKFLANRHRNTMSSARSLVRAAFVLLLIAPPFAAQVPLAPGFVDAAAVVDGLVVDMRYFGTHNFVGEKIDGYQAPRCLLSQPAADALAAVQLDLAGRGQPLPNYLS
jgi:D-alanyl-D-alanine dipeptidase